MEHCLSDLGLCVKRQQSAVPDEWSFVCKLDGRCGICGSSLSLEVKSLLLRTRRLANIRCSGRRRHTIQPSRCSPGILSRACEAASARFRASSERLPRHSAWLVTPPDHHTFPLRTDSLCAKPASWAVAHLATVDHLIRSVGPTSTLPELDSIPVGPPSAQYRHGEGRSAELDRQPAETMALRAGRDGLGGREALRLARLAS